VSADSDLQTETHGGGRKVAFIGVGNMGGPMAVNLVRAGYSVVAFDLSKPATVAVGAQGVAVADSPKAAAQDADIVITMLPAGGHVLDAYTGAGQLLSSADPGTLFIDCSTIDVVDARTASRATAEYGHRFVDAPVSGGVGGATAATLTFMVGGSLVDFEAAKPVLQAMGKKVVYCGDSGAGQAAKICNNMILGISMIAVSEAFVLGESLGLSHQALFDVASSASGQCWALTSNCPVPGPVPTSPANRGYQAGFALSLMAKDLRLARSAAEAFGVAAELGNAAAAKYDELSATDLGTADFSAVVNVIRARSAVPGGYGA
jgi:3-hydroxyisobutyrate dehydrogenase